MQRFKAALGFGILKVMSKMGISTLASYKVRHRCTVAAEQHMTAGHWLLPCMLGFPRPCFSRGHSGHGLVGGWASVSADTFACWTDFLQGAQIFEALGLAPEVIDACFPGTRSRIGGSSFAQLGADTLAPHAQAYEVIVQGGIHN